MKTKSIFLLLVLVMILPSKSNAQGWILRRAIDRKIEHKVDSAVDKSDKDDAKARQQATKNDTTKTSGTQKKGTKETGRGLFGAKIDTKYEDEYKFTGRIYMQMENYDKKDVVKSDYYTYYNSNTLNAGIEMLPLNAKEGDKTYPTVFLFDNDNRSFMMIVETKDSKTGIISSIPSDSTMVAQAKTQKEANPEKATITKTGNSRVIAGYKCDEYKIVDAEKEGYSNVWMTKDVKLKADKKYWGKAGVPTYYNYPGFEGAMMLAMDSFDKNNKPTLKMETKEINDKFSHSISTVGLTFMKMNFGQAGKK
jgi:Domain of unknown function (DUF4412)